MVWSVGRGCIGIGDGYWSGGGGYCEGGYWVFIWDGEEGRPGGW